LTIFLILSIISRMSTRFSDGCSGKAEAGALRASRRALFGIGPALLLGGAAARADSAAPVTLLAGVFVAGDAHYDFAAAKPGPRAGDALVLRREPGNRHDPRAIEVLTRAGLELGYVPRRSNEAVARLMDAGVATDGVVERAGPELGRTGRPPPDDYVEGYVFTFAVRAALG
jgi:hypothetical protein